MAGYFLIYMDINDIYRFCLTLIRKNQSASITAIEFQDYWNAEQSAYMSDLLGHFQRNANDKTGTNTGLVLNQSILTEITPFTKPINLVVASGQATKPSDFIYTLAVTYNGVKIMHVNHNQVSDINESVIDPPSLTDTKYYYTEYLNYFKLFPSTVGNIDLDYIAQPRDVKWAYTFDISGRQVYDVGSSIQSQWGDLDNREISKRVLKSIGVSLGAKDFENFGNSVIASGN